MDLYATKVKKQAIMFWNENSLISILQYVREYLPQIRS